MHRSTGEGSGCQCLGSLPLDSSAASHWSWQHHWMASWYSLDIASASALASTLPPFDCLVVAVFSFIVGKGFGCRLKECNRRLED